MPARTPTRAKKSQPLASAAPSRNWGLWPIFGSIFAAVLAAYWPALRGGLVWDDSGHITAPALQSLHGLWRIWFSLGATQQYYPLLHSAFWFEHRLWGDAVVGYHLVNVAQHALAACLVFLIVRRLALPGAWLAALIFALHPVSVEAVAWISEQKSTLSAVFYLASALVYLRFDQTRRQRHYLWALGLFVLALLSKTVTATLPAALLVIFWWQRGRLDWRRDVRPLLPWFALGAGAGLTTSWVERAYIGAQGADFALSPVERALVAGRAICFYAAKLFWPANLTFNYPRWRLDTSAWWQFLYPLGVVALLVALALLARRRRAPLAAFLLFTGTLFPVLGFLNVYPFLYSFVADHFQYLASLAIIVPAAAILTRICPKPAIAAVLPAVLGVLAWHQSAIYRDVETLYRDTLAHNPESWLAHNNLGVRLVKSPGHFAEAIGEYQAALRINPNDAQAHNNLGNALAQMPGRLPGAIAEYHAALRIAPRFAEAHNSLGSAWLATPGRLPDALAEFETALRLRPDYAEAHNNRGNALARMPGRLPEAVMEYQEAIRLAPNAAETHENLASALWQMPGRQDDAVTEFEAALAISPEYAEAHNGLGIALAQMPGRLPEALAEFETALRLSPGYAEAHNNRGNALARMPGRMAEALAEFQAAVRLRPDYAEAHENLGIALAQVQGPGPEAIRELQAAVRFNPGDAHAHSNLGVLLSEAPGRMPEALAESQAAVRIDPNNAEAHYNLGNALARFPGRMADAATEFRAALRIRPDYAPARANLAAVCAKSAPGCADLR